MHAYIGLGSNLGDRRERLRQGLAGMARRGLVPDRISSVWETEPVDAPLGTEPLWFLNMVARVPTELAPEEVLRILLKVEGESGRTRGARNAPRLLDLDLLLHGDLNVVTPDLEVPHPRMWGRRFVLAPLAEIAPELTDPTTGRRVDALLREVRDPARVRLLGRL